MDEIKRIEQLRKELHEHNYRYYVLNQPTIGDQDFDFMMKELQELMDELGMNNMDIPILDNLTGSLNEMVDAFENKIKEMTEGFQKNSLEFNNFLTNSLNG